MKSRGFAKSPIVERAIPTICAPLPESVVPSAKRTAKAVRGQSRTVSKNTSEMPKSPASHGVELIFVDCAIPEVPEPASLERSAREKPSFIFFVNRKNDTPPPAALKLKADFIILKARLGIFSLFKKITHIARAEYKIALIGMIYLQALVLENM